MHQIKQSETLFVLWSLPEVLLDDLSQSWLCFSLHSLQIFSIPRPESQKNKKIANPLVLLSLQLSLDRKSKKNQKISLFLSPELEEWPKISFALDFSSFSLNRDPEWSKITLSLLSSFLYQQRFRNPTPKKIAQRITKAASQILYRLEDSRKQGSVVTHGLNRR